MMPSTCDSCNHNLFAPGTAHAAGNQEEQEARESAKLEKRKRSGHAARTRRRQAATVAKGDNKDKPCIVHVVHNRSNQHREAAVQCMCESSINSHITNRFA